MRGFQPAAARAKAKPFANGGPVRGPGTGTSDDVPDEVERGTYIMPADSTQAVGQDQLASMGARGFSPAGDKLPVQLSNGEYKLPPEQVHAIGVQALDQMKDATHSPVGGIAPGTQGAPEPRMFFANGGVADDERLRPRGFGDAAAVSNAATSGRQGLIPYAPNYGPAGFVPRSPAPPPTPAPAPTAEGAVAGANDASLRYSGIPLSPVQRNAVTSNFEQEQRGFAEGAAAASQNLPYGPSMGVDAPRGLPAAAPAAPARVAPSFGRPAAPNSFQRAGVGDDPYNIGKTASTSAPSAPVNPPGPSNVTKAVGPDGQVTYSGKNITGDITVNGGAGRGTVTDLGGQGLTSADRIDQYNRTGAIYRDIGGLRQQIQQAEDAQNGLIPGGGMAVLGTSPTSLFERTPEQQLRDARVSSRSLMNEPRVFGTRRGLPGAPANLAAEEAAALERNQASAQSAAQGFQSAERREAMQQQGANQRNELTNRTNLAEVTARGLRDRDRIALDTRKADSDIEAQGYANRAAAQQEQLRAVLADPKSTPAQRTQAQQALAAMAGKPVESPWKLQVTPATKNADGSTSEGSIYRYNTQTGQVERADGGSPQALPMPARDQLKAGAVYQTSRGAARWDGKQFTAV
ncbi:hypothetical protein [Ottowia sp. VDI28]|uniref:hypothetical protein n=1 Tax=Ottowia sp. VDI28 TaxID=3133968 RepID=UPI003C2D1EBD